MQTVPINNRAQVDKALLQADVGDIHAPHLIDSGNAVLDGGTQF
jgi:hypothetical protein